MELINYRLERATTKSGVVPPHSKAASAAVGNNWPRI
jgi:hypothetical protein